MLKFHSFRATTLIYSPKTILVIICYKLIYFIHPLLLHLKISYHTTHTYQYIKPQQPKHLKQLLNKTVQQFMIKQPRIHLTKRHLIHHNLTTIIRCILILQHIMFGDIIHKLKDFYGKNIV
jgi:hypothetical protein